MVLHFCQCVYFHADHARITLYGLIIIACTELTVYNNVCLLISSSRSLGRAQTAQALIAINAMREADLPTKVTWGVSWFCMHWCSNDTYTTT